MAAANTLAYYIGKAFFAKTSTTGTEYALTLATLGFATQIGSFLFVSHIDIESL
jgi:hypothetical protein